MRVLPLIELMLTLNLLLFMAVFVLWTRAPFAVRMLFERLRQRHPRLDRQTLVSLTCLIMDWLGLAFALSLLCWGSLTAFVITLYRGGFFWRL